MKNSRELVAHALKGVRPARTPIFDILCNDEVIAHFAGRKLNGTDDEATARLALSRAVDCSRSIPLPGIEGATYTDDMGNLVETARWTSWIRRHRLQDVEGWAGWIARNIEALESEETPSADRVAQEKARQEAFNAAFGGSVFMHCRTSTSVNTAMFGYLCGLEHFCYLWFDRRELVLRWMKAIQAHELNNIALTAHAGTGPLAMIYSDVAFKQRLMFGMDMFRELGFFDNVARICDACHQRGLRVIFHSDGYVMEIMPDLVAAGIDGFNPIEKAAGMDIYELRRRYPELILVGGVDVTHLLPRGTEAEIRRETRRIIDEVGAEGRLLIGSTTELENNVPLGNYLAFHDEVMNG